MSQHEVYEIIKKSKKPLSTNEISEKLKKRGIDITITTIQNNIKRLINFREVQFHKFTPSQAKIFFNKNLNQKKGIIRFYFVK